MATVSSLSAAELRGRLAGPGIYLRTGSFVTLLRSSVAHVADGIGLLYADYPLEDAPGFADFHVNLDQAGGLRRWFRRQVVFKNDGHAPFKPLPLDQAFPMFEWSMNWCVSSRAHDCLIIHAAVIERDGVAALLPAPPGSGKSTLCAALVLRGGWRLLSDELTLVRLSDGLIEPLPRPVSLKNASIEVIRAWAPEAVFSRAVHDTNKGTVAHVKAPSASVARAHEAARAGLIVFPQYVAGSSAVLEPMARGRAFMQVADNAFNYSTLGGAGFDALGELVAGSASYRFRYASLDEAIDTFARLAALAA
ncbi:HprK-related kinase A [Massilia sp. TSP1-1-2]|uniref:HprK-related kinase A n=1 Tax=Massilia sp. TSP1-1-2 TaxID=2804649 RepID=UPI003CF485F0